MKLIVPVLGLLISLAPALAHADQVFTFQSVDGAKRVWNSRVEVTGILAAESAPTTLIFNFVQSTQDGAAAAFVTSCYQNALLAMNRPGRFQLEVTRASSGLISDCALRRNQ